MKAKAYKIELFILDVEGLREEDVIYFLENVTYLDPKVMSVQSKELGEWYDDHPINKKDTFKQTYDELFGGLK
jgi:hypothetical protein